MANSTSPIPQVLEGAGAVQALNELNDAASPAMTGGRWAAGITGPLVFAVLGGRVEGVEGANTAVTLTASQTNYVVRKKADGVVSTAITTTNWNDATNYYRLYSVVTGTTSVTSYTDERQSSAGLSSAGGSTGTVTSVDASGGVETTSGSAITATGTIRGASLVNAQTGTSYTYVTGDRGKLVTHSNASAIAGTLPQATGTFPAGWFMRIKNKGVGTLTITPTTSTIDGASTLALTTGQSAMIVSDGTNYQVAFLSVAAGSVNWGSIGGTLTGQTDLQAALDAKAQDRRTVSALSTSSGVVNIDCSLGDYFTLALSANVTSITFSNLPGSGKGASLMIRITQDTTARTVAWPSSFQWDSGSAGAVSTGSGVIDVLAITTFDNGTKWQATLSKGRA